MNRANVVVVTGSAGRVGQTVVEELRARGQAVRGFDRVPTPGVGDSVVGDIADLGACARACAGAHTLIHLAATPDDDDFMTRLLPDNLVGLYNMMEAARVAGVRRLILPSSGQVSWWRAHSGPWPIHPDEAVAPKYWYAATKMFMEAIGRSYAEVHGQSVIVARLGWCPRTKAQVEEIAASEWAQDVYLSPADSGRFFACAVEAPEDLKFAIVYATSRPLHVLRYDLEPTRRLLGYEPREQWPQGIEIVK